jgi:sigma-B regulation protein RsbU (phosphoserine phosphatase)
MNMFATLFFGVVDPATGSMAYINGGHEPPFIIDATGLKTRLSPTGPAVGYVPDMKFKIKQIEIEPGDMLFGFTDGVIEALAPNGQMFTRDRLVSIVERKSASAAGMMKRIRDKLRIHINNAKQADDITMIALQRLPRV